jgi:hypothetical protein
MQLPDTKHVEKKLVAIGLRGKGSDSNGFPNYYGSSGTSYIYIYVCYALFKAQTYTAV